MTIGRPSLHRYAEDKRSDLVHRTHHRLKFGNDRDVKFLLAPTAGLLEHSIAFLAGLYPQSAWRAICNTISIRWRATTVKNVSFYAIPALLILGLCFSAPGAVTAVHAQQHCGDHDGSGRVSATDALLLLQFVVGHPVEVGCPTGLHCWDTEDNGVCDEVDDINLDGYCDILDCQGPMGPEGPMGPMGPGGHGGGELAEIAARVDTLSAAVAALQQLHAE